MSKFTRSFVFVLVALAFVIAACGGQATEVPATEAPATEAPTEAATEEATEAPVVEEDPMAMYAPDAVDGDIITAGSSTVFPLSERMAELFQDEGFVGSVTVDSIGSGAGFERFCVAGESDVANASRAIKEEEVASCQSIGREPIEFRVGTDALAVVVSAENDFLTDLTLEQLGQIFSGAVTTWDQVDPSYPAEAIQVYSPGADSGTFDYFVEEVMEDFGGEEALLGLAGAQFSEDDNVLVQGVEGSPYAIGYFGYAYYVENSGALKALFVDGVEPTQDAVDAGEYPLARPLFIYSDATIMAEKPQVAAFIYFYLTNVNDNIVDVGYFPAPAADLDSAMAAWEEAVAK
ncbi:MAG: PstS family phosphate ABC transporter substrate-binding protein [Anaerolineales bacterium]|nr:PstS family phosphate ABC transporter substrate-binding protein [Anaerolineales bacterium]